MSSAVRVVSAVFWLFDSASSHPSAPVSASWTGFNYTTASSLDIGFHAASSGLYFVLFCAAVTQLLRLHWHISQQGLRRSQLFHRQLLCVFVALGAIIRSVWFAINALMMAQRMFMFHAIEFLINALPTVFFITTFSVLLVFVITLYYLVHNLKLSFHIPLVAIVINSVMYVAMLILFLLEFFYFPDNPEDRPRVANIADAVIELVLIAIFFLVAVIFTVYGLRLRRKFGWMPSTSSDLRAVLRRSVLCAVVCSAAFLCRCVVLGVTLAGHPALQSTTAVIVPYFLLLDALPVTLLLLLIASPPPRRPAVVKPLSLSFAPSERSMLVSIAESA